MNGYSIDYNQKHLEELTLLVAQGRYIKEMISCFLTKVLG